MTERSRIAAVESLARSQIVRRRWLHAIAAAFFCGFVTVGDSPAQDAGVTASVQSVKAAYLFKLPTYVDWPAQRFERSDSALTIGVLGADDVAEALSTLTTGRTVNGRAVVVRRLGLDEELEGAHVVFFSGDARSRAGSIAADAVEQSILTVTDLDLEAPDSVIDFVTVNGRLRFEVHLGTAERNQLRLHAGLLNVASRIYRARR